MAKSPQVKLYVCIYSFTNEQRHAFKKPEPKHYLSSPVCLLISQSVVCQHQETPA